MSDLTLNDLLYKYSGDHINLYFSEFQYRYGAFPSISISECSDDFDMKEFLLENPLGVLPIIDFHVRDSSLKILLYKDYYSENKKED